MRPIDKVIDAIAAELPPRETESLEHLAWLKKDAGYKPPEMMGYAWDVLAEWVNAAIPNPPIKDWQKRVVAIFTDTVEPATSEQKGTSPIR